MSKQRVGLVIERKCDEAVVIGPPHAPTAVVRVLAVRDGRIKLGIVADPSIAVNREEVAERKLEEGLGA